MRIWLRSLGTLFTLFILLLTPAGSARAATTVGNGSAASCSEAALTNALTVGGTITFSCGGAATITLTSAKSIKVDTTLEGAGQITLSGGGTTRLFFIDNGVRFTANNIVLREGASPVGGGLIEASGALVSLNNVKLLDSYAPNQGGAIYCFVASGGTLTISNSLIDQNSSTKGSAIYNDGCLLTIDGSQITNNSASLSGITPGGGIYNAGPLRISNSTLSGNQATDGGAIYNASGADAILTRVTLYGNKGEYGAGIENSGLLTITDSLIDGNTAQNSGGGIWNQGGHMALMRTTISNNIAGEGGGIASYGVHTELNQINLVDNTATTGGTFGGGGAIKQSSGTLFMRNTTISGNQATSASGDGGGIYQDSDDNLTLTNVTISGNSAGRFGGAIYHKARYAILTNVTIGENSASAGSALYEDADSGPGRLTLRNTAIFGSANNCDGGLFSSDGHNVSAGTCVSLSDTTDRTGISDSKVGPLAFNGGVFAMQTYLPQPGSPLLDSGACLSDPADDQRGVSRPQGSTCDIGAIERRSSDGHWFVYLPFIRRS